MKKEDVKYNNFIKGDRTPEDKIYSTLLLKPDDITFAFNFCDGEQAVFTNDKAGLKSMQDFLDLMNKTHILQKQLEIAVDALKFYSNDNTAAVAQITLKQIEELLK